MLKPNAMPWTLGWPKWLLTAVLMYASALLGCADVPAYDDRPYDDEELVGAYGVDESEVATTTVLSANGKYGASCIGVANLPWSVALVGGAPLDNLVLAVPKLNTSCTLALTSLRTGIGSSNLYTAAAPITLGTAYGSSVVFSSPSSSFPAQAKLSASDFLSTFTLSVVIGDNNTGTQSIATHYLYEAQVDLDGPLSYWRLNDTAPSSFVDDTFTGTNATLLQNRSGSLGASWTKNTAASTSGVDAILEANRVRANSNKTAVYTASGAPSSANYTVSADLYMASLLSDDQAGVIGRASSTANTYYFAGIKSSQPLFLVYRDWVLRKVVNGTVTDLASTSASVSAGGTYRVSLEMNGSSLTMYVNGNAVLSATDSAIPGANLAGLTVGLTGGSSSSSSAGVHVDNFNAILIALADDAEDRNDGIYRNSPTLGATGLLGGNTAVTFDGTNDYINMARQVADDFSIELWFKSTQGISTSSNWYDGAALVDATASGANDFGVSLRSDGKVMAGVGVEACLGFCNYATTIVSSGTTSYRDGAWHHVVFTRTKSNGALQLYVDGSSKGTASGGSNSLNDAAKITIGANSTGGNYFAGTIDEVAVYSKVLSAATVLKHYQAGTR